MTDPTTRHDLSTAPESSELLTLLHAVTRRVRREAGTHLSGEGGATPGQYRLLHALGRCDGPRRLSALAEVLDVAPRSITSKVDDAEADGLVRRLPDPTDRRATLVELTPAGHDVLARVTTARAAEAEALLDRLSPAERRELLRLLRVVAG